MSILNIGEMSVDRFKSPVMLYYLARAALKQNERELRKRKVELEVKQLKKIDTKVLQKHLDNLDIHVQHAVGMNQEVMAEQADIEVVHKRIAQKIRILEEKLTRCAKTKDGRNKRIAHLEEKIKHEFLGRQEKEKAIEFSISNLTTLYSEVKRSKNHTKEDLERVKNRIAQLRQRLKRLKGK